MRYMLTSVHELPVIEHTLGEGLAGSLRTKVSVETERLHDRQVRFHGEHGSSNPLLFAEHLTTTLIETTVDTTNSVFGALDFDCSFRSQLVIFTRCHNRLILTKVYGLLETGFREKTCSIADATASRDDLSTSAMDGISVKLQTMRSGAAGDSKNAATYGDINNVDPDSTHLLFSTHTFLCRPLECSNARILDFIQVLHTLGDIDQQIRTSSIRTETPDLPSVSDIPTVLIGEDTGTGLEIVTGADSTAFDGFCELFVNGLGLDVKTIVLVLRF